ncbi:MAG: DUF92 domain-containing protein [Methanophagales archaeon]|nr:DUF92 domain-containing protein [Methanophagales archaeon]
MAFSEHLLITAITLSVAFSFVLYAYVKRKINTSAFIGTLALGVIILLTFGLEFGYAGLLALLTFFLVGNWVTRYKYDKKAELGVAEGNKGMRGIPNVLGNGLAPLIFAVLYAVSRESYYSTLFLLGFSGAVATACADTFSTEIGEAEGNPRLITTFKKVPVGTNGGISLPGLGAAVLGSFLISIVCLAFVSAGDKAPIRSIFFSVCLISGFFGCIADSIFGATIEDKPFYKKRLQTFLHAKSVTKNATPASQFRLNKHGVNILSTLSGGLCAVVLGYSFGVQMV